MPAPIVEYSLIVCEHALHENDGVLSAIRIVDLFFINPTPEVPLERRAVKMSVIFRARIADSEEHKLKLGLLRPNGEEAFIVETPPTLAESRYPGVAAAITGVAEVGVLAREMGTHHFVLYCDGAEVGRTAFTLRLRDAEKSQPQP